MSFRVSFYNRAWKNRIKSIQPDHQVEVYQTLCIIASEPDPTTFENRIAQFLKVWGPKEPEFAKYFAENYQNRAGIYII